MRLAVVLSGALLVATGPVLAKIPAPWPSGVYGNVHTIEETGDMLGMEARFFRQDGRTMVEFVWCEGWCNDVHVMPVVRQSRGFGFHYSQRPDVGPASEYRFVAQRGGKGLNISVWQGREPLNPGAPYSLRPLGKPFAIPFAKANGAR